MRFQVFFCPFGISATSISPSAALPAALFLLAARHREHLRIINVSRIVLPIIKIPQFWFKTSLIKTLNFESPAWATDNFSHGLQRTTRPVFRHPPKVHGGVGRMWGNTLPPILGSTGPFSATPSLDWSGSSHPPKPPRRPPSTAQAQGDRNSRQHRRNSR